MVIKPGDLVIILEGALSILLMKLDLDYMRLLGESIIDSIFESIFFSIWHILILVTLKIDPISCNVIGPSLAASRVQF